MFVFSLHMKLLSVLIFQIFYFFTVEIKSEVTVAYQWIYYYLAIIIIKPAYNYDVYFSFFFLNLQDKAVYLFVCIMFLKIFWYNNRQRENQQWVHHPLLCSQFFSPFFDLCHVIHIQPLPKGV